MYSMIFLFIEIVIGLLSATISYYKGFKVNSRILLSIEKYAGYNKYSKGEIENYLSSIGYTVSSNGQADCKDRGDLKPIKSNDVGAGDTKYLYCVYYYSNENASNKASQKNGDGKATYYNYGVVSYIYIDLPIVGGFKVPVYSKGERIYNFSDGQNQLGVDNQ